MDCGEEIVTKSTSLISGVTQSCGCYGRERAAQTHTTHGLHDHPLYAVWYAMKDRCYNSKNRFYHRYGGRDQHGGKNIRVCDQWLANFINFYNWAMSKNYRLGLTLERTDNDGDYEPGNCRWATQLEQNQNTSLTKMTPAQVIAIKNDTRYNYVIAKDYGVDASTISRIKNRTTWTNIV